MEVKDKSQILEKFSLVAGALINPSIEEFKNKGGRVIGYFCSFIPEEIFIAADILPFRIRGTGGCYCTRPYMLWRQGQI